MILYETTKKQLCLTVDNLSRVCRLMFLRDRGTLTAAQDREPGKKKNNRQQRHIFQIYLAE